MGDERHTATNPQFSRRPNRVHVAAPIAKTASNPAPSKFVTRQPQIGRNDKFRAPILRRLGINFCQAELRHTHRLCCRSERIPQGFAMEITRTSPAACRKSVSLRRADPVARSGRGSPTRRARVRSTRRRSRSSPVHCRRRRTAGPRRSGWGGGGKWRRVCWVLAGGFIGESDRCFATIPSEFASGKAKRNLFALQTRCSWQPPSRADRRKLAQIASRIQRGLVEATFRNFSAVGSGSLDRSSRDEFRSIHRHARSLRAATLTSERGADRCLARVRPQSQQQWRG